MPTAATTTAALRNGRMIEAETETAEIPIKKTAQVVLAMGSTSVGRKIGFSNRRIWEEYGVHAPMWGYVYDRTMQDLAVPLPLAPYAEPKIEPEIMLGFVAAPSPGMDDAALLSCIGWVAHGFEIVQSI